MVTGWVGARLGRMRIGTKLVALSAVPLAAVILLAAAQIQTHYREAQRARLVGDAVELAQRLHTVVRAHAVERDRSVAQLEGAGGGGDLSVARERASQAAAALRELRREGLGLLNPAPLQEGFDRLAQALDRRETVREWVDSGRRTDKAFTFYSELNAEALRLLQRVAGQVHGARLARQLRAFSGALWMQELAARERGKLAGVFAAGATNPDQFLAIRGYSRAQQRHRATFLRNATTDQRRAFKESLDSPAVERVASIRANFLDPDASLADGPDAPTWFRLATTRIERIQAVADRIAEDLRSAATTRVAGAQGALWGNAALAGGVVAVVGFLALTISHSIVRPLREVTLLTERITQSERWDLSLRLPEDGGGEIGRLSRAFNAFLGVLQEVVGGIASKTDDLGNARVQLSDGAERIHTSTAEARDQVQRVATSAEEVNGVVQEVARNISGVSQSVSETTRTTQQGKQAVDEAAGKIQELKASSGRADQILASIQEVAKKTDLLALNAAIEAANAGEQGKGFAVVADEVRQLAEQTRQATEQVGQIVGEVQGHSDDSAQAMDRILDHMDAVLERIEGIDGSANQIAASTEELAATMNETTDNMQAINERTDQVVAQASDIQGTAGEVGALSEGLQEMTGRFRSVG